MKAFGKPSSVAEVLGFEYTHMRTSTEWEFMYRLFMASRARRNKGNHLCFQLYVTIS